MRATAKCSRAARATRATHGSRKPHHTPPPKIHRNAADVWTRPRVNKQVLARKRIPYFQRPKHPRDWRWWVGGIGRVLVVTGLLMFAFVGYQLWGTGIQTARAQNTLQSDFERLMASTTTSPATTTTTAVTDDTVDAPVVTSSTVPVAPDGPPIPDGDVLAQLLDNLADLTSLPAPGPVAGAGVPGLALATVLPTAG